MLFRPIAVILAAVAAFCVSAPASAQFFLKPADLSGEPVTGAEPGILGPAMPGATANELRAAMVWNIRAAMNIAALQCQFEPTLLTVDHYDALLDDHKAELASALTTLEKYFTRTVPDKRASAKEFDRFQTRLYSSFSTVSGQLSFCQTAASIGQDAVYTPRGQLGEVAARRLRELRASLAAWGEQQFRGRRSAITLPAMHALPPFGNERCWRGSDYQVRKCGKLG